MMNDALQLIAIDVGNTRIRIGRFTGDELCGAESSAVALGFAGSDEYCRDDVRDHRYFDAHRIGPHFIELSSREPAVRVWIARAEGHRFQHYDEHGHH